MAEAQKTRGPVELLGARLLAGLGYAGGMTLLLGAALRWLGRMTFSPKVSFGRRALAEQMVRVGVKSLAIVALVQTFIGIILALQMTPPLAKWGQEAQVAVIIGVAGFRMLGPIITAVVLSGFAGASIAAELGSMVVSEEVEALEVMALNPIRYLVVPRLLAAVLILPIITTFAIAAGGLGAFLVAVSQGVSAAEYIASIQRFLSWSDLFGGLAKTMVFGGIIAMVGTYRGLTASGGAQGVGRATTSAVVLSIVLIYAVNYFLSWLILRLWSGG